MLNLEIVKCKVTNKDKLEDWIILYIAGYPAYKILPNGEIDETDPITPNGCGIYYNNKEFVDKWLKNNFANVARQVRH